MKKNELGKQQSRERGLGIRMGRKKKSYGEGELKPRKWEKEKRNEREGDLKKNIKIKSTVIH